MNKIKLKIQKSKAEALAETKKNKHSSTCKITIKNLKNP